MNNKGFTLIELLGSIAILGIVLMMGIYASRDTVATSLTTFRNVRDNEVFTAARNYVVGENISLKKGYACVYVRDLIDYGYLENTNDEEVVNKLVKVSRNNVTKVINQVKYVNICE